MTFTLVNKTDSALPVYWIKSSGEEGQTVLSARGTITFEAEALSPQTLSLASTGKLAVNPFSGGVSGLVPQVQQPHFGLIWGRTWQTDFFYKEGWTVRHDGAVYIVLTAHRSTDTPDIDTARYFRFALDAPEQFFGIASSAFNTGELIVKTALGWESKKITDGEVDTLSIAKVTSLQGLLDSKVPLAGGAMTGFLSLHANPTAGEHAANKNYVDTIGAGMLAVTGGTMTGALLLNGNPTVALEAAPKQYVDNRLALSGGAMTGFLLLHANPTLAAHAANKAYVDTMVPLAGGAMTGFLSLHANPTAGAHAANKNYVDTGLAARLPLAGGTLSGQVLQPSTPTLEDHLTRKGYVDTQVATRVSSSGGTMTGFLSLHANPTNALHAATKQYVDGLVGGGSLPLSGGTMTGPILGTHGLLSLGGGTMAGAVILAPLSDDDGGDPREGLYFSTDTNSPSYDGKKLELSGVSAVVSSANYTVPPEVGLVLVRYQGNSTIELGDPSNYSGPVTVVQDNSEPFNQVFVVRPDSSNGFAESSLSTYRQSVTYRPVGNQWAVATEFVPSDKEYSIAWGEPSAEIAEKVSVSGTLYKKETVVDIISGVTNEGSGNVGFTVATGAEAKYQVGDGIYIGGTSSYNGFRKIVSLSAGKIVCAAAFVSTQTGTMNGVVYRSLVDEPVALSLSVSPSFVDPYATPPAGLVLGVSGGGREVFRQGGLVTLVTSPAGVFTLEATDTTASAFSLYVFHLSSGGHFGSIRGERNTAVTDMQRLAANVNSAVDRSTEVTTTFASVADYKTLFAVAFTGVIDGGGGEVWLEMADVEDFAIGDLVNVVGTANYNGDYTVNAINFDLSRIRITAAFVATQAGDLRIDNIVLTVVDEVGFDFNHPVTISGSAGYNGSHVVADVSAASVRLKTRFIANDSGTLTHAGTRLVLASSSGFLVNDEIEILSSVSYNGTWIVLQVNTASNWIIIASSFAGNDSGVARNNNSLQFTLRNENKFSVNQPVIVRGVTSAGDKSTFLSRILSVVGSNIVIREEFNALGETTGMVEHSASKQLVWTA